ncbi:MAG: anthranilate synthase component I family protein [Bacteroidota bacterium]
MEDVVFLLNDSKGRKLLAVGAEREVTGDLGALNSFLAQNKGAYCFGFLSYDVKNQIEQLSSENELRIDFPELYFCVPEIVVELNGKDLHYLKGEENETVLKLVGDLEEPPRREVSHQRIDLIAAMTKAEYVREVSALLNEIQRGNAYEITYCQEFYAENVSIDPWMTYLDLHQRTNAPYSCFVRNGDNYLLSGSPERFMRKKGSQLISQPIKGTAKRGRSTAEDARVKEQLMNNEKELAENVMIVDLVRNDLSRIAERNSVRVEELCGLHTFETVHQLISTVVGEISPETSFVDIIKALFPMGSMTGAPKVSAMQLIEKHETFRRGLFSGTVGYIDPDGDFDFNVIIRSILYNGAKQLVSCPVGGAITIQSDPEGEYEECLIKVDALKKVLHGN